MMTSSIRLPPVECLGSNVEHRDAPEKEGKVRDGRVLDPGECPGRERLAGYEHDAARQVVGNLRL